jgi:hypothetical protein
MRPPAMLHACVGGRRPKAGTPANCRLCRRPCQPSGALLALVVVLPWMSRAGGLHAQSGWFMSTNELHAWGLFAGQDLAVEAWPANGAVIVARKLGRAAWRAAGDWGLDVERCDAARAAAVARRRLAPCPAAACEGRGRHAIPKVAGTAGLSYADQGAQPCYEAAAPAASELPAALCTQTCISIWSLERSCGGRRRVTQAQSSVDCAGTSWPTCWDMQASSHLGTAAAATHEPEAIRG